MPSPSPSIHASARLRRIERAIPRVDPADFLAANAGEVRGFWGRGERWVAWAGELARIEAGNGDGRDRFARVRREARRIVSGDRAGWAARPPDARPRFYGGFSFLDSSGANGSWEGFYSAAFVLPRVVLEARPDGCRLVVQSLESGGAGDGAGGAEESGGASEVAGDAEAELERMSGASPGGPARDLGPDGGDAGPWETLRNATSLERERWDGAVRDVLAGVERGAIKKVVLSRILDADFAGEVDALASLRFMRRENPRAHVFLFEPRPGRIFFGAAPEILAELRGGRFQATAVAGSAPRAADPDEDRALAAALRGSAKDRSEHLLTAEEMAEVLAPRLTGMEVEEDPRILRLARIQHLETTIRGRARDSEDVLSLVEALHPTPAVCGRPRGAALELIRAAEPFDRGWYAGPVGWFDPGGDGDFVPALRSAVGRGARWRLFAGAGLVAGSDPDAEWDETALKFEPALRALAAGSNGGAT